MRLIDADTLVKDLSYLYTKNHIPVDMRAKEILTTIMEQPTVYSVDKVVDELEKRKQEYLEAFIIHLDNELYGISCGLGDAIEIVKQGGVSDDECEWKQASTARYKTSCGYKLEEYFDTNACYCKQCGKKIKIVGD